MSEHPDLQNFVHFLIHDGWMSRPSDMQSLLDRYAMAEERNWYPRGGGGQ